MAGALDSLTPDDGALGALSDQSSADMDVQSRKDIFNRAVQRIIQSRNAIQTPYAGNDMGMLSLAASMGKASGLPVAEGFTGGMLERAKAQEAQSQAAQTADQQRSGLDLRAQMAQILGDGGENSLQDAAALGAVGGDDKASDSLAKLQLYGNRATTAGGATIAAAKALMAADPTLDFPTAFSIAKSGVGTGNTVKNGQIKDIGGSIETGAKRKSADTTAEEEAKLNTEKESKFPKATASLANAFASDEVVNKNIDEALPGVNAWTAGFLGSKVSRVAGTPAYDLEAKLKTIKANLGFDKLQEMRDSSPTGGAIGQVSDFEEKLLSSAVQNIDNAQSPEQLKKALLDLKQVKAGQKARLQQAYQMDYGKFIKQPPAAKDTAKPLPTPEQAKALLAARRAKNAPSINLGD